MHTVSVFHHHKGGQPVAFDFSANSLGLGYTPPVHPNRCFRQWQGVVLCARRRKNKYDSWKPVTDFCMLEFGSVGQSEMYVHSQPSASSVGAACTVLGKIRKHAYARHESVHFPNCFQICTNSDNNLAIKINWYLKVPHVQIQKVLKARVAPCPIKQHQGGLKQDLPPGGGGLVAVLPMVPTAIIIPSSHSQPLPKVALMGQIPQNT